MMETNLTYSEQYLNIVKSADLLLRWKAVAWSLPERRGNGIITS